MYDGWLEFFYGSIEDWKFAFYAIIGIMLLYFIVKVCVKLFKQ